MISASHAFTNGRFHQSRQRRQYIDGGIDLVIGVCGGGGGGGGKVGGGEVGGRWGEGRWGESKY